MKPLIPVLSLAVGLAIGATTATFFLKNRYQHKAEAQIEEMRKEYVEKYEKARELHVHAAKQYTIENSQISISQANFRRKIRWLAKHLVSEEIANSAESVSSEEFNNRVSKYEMDVPFDQNGEPIWPKDADEVRSDYISKEDIEEYDTEEGDDMPKITKFDWSSLGKKVDTDYVHRLNEAVDNDEDIAYSSPEEDAEAQAEEDDDDDDDYSADLDEVDRQESDDPYIISREQYNEDDEYDQYGLTYYEKDGVLCEADGDSIVEDENHIVGDALSHFGEKSNDRDVVYVENPGTTTKYEVIRVHGSYQEFVLGIKDEYEEDSSPRKMRRYDD